MIITTGNLVIWKIKCCKKLPALFFSYTITIYF